MTASKVLLAYLLLALNIAVMFFLEQKLTTRAGELLFIFFSLVFAFLILKGLKNDSLWTWPALMVFFAMALVNTVYLFMATKYLPAFLLIIITNLFGMVSAMVWALEEDEEPVDKQDLEFESYEEFSKRIDEQIEQLKAAKAERIPTKKRTSK